MTKKKNRKGGRRASYKDYLTKDGLLKLEAWARDGLTNEQIAHNIGIHPSTLYDWQKGYPEIAQTLKRGKEVVDIEVENALLKKALGYKYTEREIYQTKDENGNIVNEKIKVIEKQQIPDTTAQIFWLKNRKPEDWRDRKETAVDMLSDINIVFEDDYGD